MSKMPISLNVEVEGSGATEGVGFAFTFESPDFDFTGTPEFNTWRDEVKALAIDIGDAMFDKDIAVSSRAVQRLVREVAAINAKYAHDIADTGDVPAIQIDSIGGKRLEIHFTPQDADKGVYRSRRDDYVPTERKEVVMSGSHCVSNAFHRKFPFMYTPAPKKSLFNDASAKKAANDGRYNSKRPKFGM